MAESTAPDVGQLLKKRRQTLKQSLQQVELATKIRGKFLISLEAGDYTKLPNDIYSQGFVRTYANYLGLDGSELVKQYLAERGGQPQPSSAQSASPKKIKTNRLVLTPKILLVALILLVVASMAGYLSWQFRLLAAAPELTVSSPTNDQVVFGSVIEVAGRVSGGADVYVNDSPLLTDTRGNFRDNVSLQDGVNSIKFSAKNKVGKVTTITKSILAYPPKAEAQAASVAPAPVDGVELAIAVRQAATALVVEADGKEVFRGTMLVGTAQLFRAQTKLKLTVGNAGAVHLMVTNAKVAGKSFSPLGTNEEVKRELEITKDQDL